MFQLIYLDNPCPVFTSKMEYFMSHDPEVLQVKNNTQVYIYMYLRETVIILGIHFYTWKINVCGLYGYWKTRITKD